MFPRSTSPVPGQHGTFKTTEARLPYVASMGFDVVYLPPIHPIGRAFRKGPNNTLTPGPDDPGSPWAIGGPEGGHKAVHPELGTLADFDHLVEAAKQARPGDRARHRLPVLAGPSLRQGASRSGSGTGPTGRSSTPRTRPRNIRTSTRSTSRCDDWEALYAELRDVFLFWVGHGVTIFRVDNPHTKPFRFWDWVIREVRDRNPDAIFLAEAFTRPKLMLRLAKGGYPQSYSYFTWRNAKWAIEQYFTELTQDRRHRDHAAEPVRQHARHPQRIPPGRRPTRFPDPPRAGRDPGGDLRDLRPAVRAVRRHPLEAGLGGVSRLREISGPPLGPRRPRQPRRVHHPGQRDPPGQPGAPFRSPASGSSRPTTTR